MGVQVGNVVALEYKQEKPRAALVLAVLKGSGVDQPWLTLAACTMSGEAEESSITRFSPVPYADENPGAVVRWRYAAPEVMVRAPIMVVDPNTGEIALETQADRAEPTPGA